MPVNDEAAASPQKMTTLARLVTLVFTIAVVINYGWELAQAPLYAWSADSRNIWWHCFIAALGDGVMVLLIFAAGWLLLGRFDWFLSPGARGYLVMLLSGLALAIGIELIAVHVLQRWTYAPSMPRVPALEIGIVPVLQMLILPPLIFGLVARFQRGQG